MGDRSASTEATELRNALWNAAVTGQITGADADLTVDQGQRMQLDLLQRHIEQGDACGGYKIGLTSGASRDAFGVNVRPFGCVLRSRIFMSPATLNLPQGWRFGLENELVFRIDTAPEKPGQADAQQMRAAAPCVAPGFEINHHRLKGSQGNGVRVADNLSQWGIVVGDFRSIEETAFEAIVVNLEHDGVVVETTRAAGHIDDHFESLARLARRLDQFDLALKPGDLVITGSFTRAPINASGTWTGRFSGVGEVSVYVSQEQQEK
ncbi:MAG: hypothetical protein O3A63_19305 [Proteobacteria bacterium]|nr:hypothetical protein [Pseudomonadota bacterium]